MVMMGEDIRRRGYDHCSRGAIFKNQAAQVLQHEWNIVDMTVLRFFPSMGMTILEIPDGVAHGWWLAYRPRRLVSCFDSGRANEIKPYASLSCTYLFFPIQPPSSLIRAKTMPLSDPSVGSFLDMSIEIAGLQDFLLCF